MDDKTPLSDKFGQLITSLSWAKPQPNLYDTQLTESITTKIQQFMQFVVAEQTKNILINLLQQTEKSYLVITNHRTYVNIAFIQSYLYTLLQEQKNLTMTPAQRHTIVWPRVTYDPLFAMIARSLSNLIQTIPATSSIDTAFATLLDEWYSQQEIDSFKKSCLLYFGRRRTEVLWKSGLIFLAPSGTTEPVDEEWNNLFLPDNHVSWSIWLIGKYQKTTWQWATIITTHEDFDTRTVSLQALSLDHSTLQQHLADGTLMQTVAEVSGGKITDPKIFEYRKQAKKVIALPLEIIMKQFKISA